MSKPETLKDLLIEGAVSKMELRNVASVLFNTEITLSNSSVLDGYAVTMPAFEELDDRLQGYVIKVLLEARVQNVFDSVEDDAEMAQDVADYDAAKAAEED